MADSAVRSSPIRQPFSVRRTRNARPSAATSMGTRAISRRTPAPRSLRTPTSALQPRARPRTGSAPRSSVGTPQSVRRRAISCVRLKTPECPDIVEIAEAPRCRRWPPPTTSASDLDGPRYREHQQCLFALGNTVHHFAQLALQQVLLAKPEGIPPGAGEARKRPIVLLSCPNSKQEGQALGRAANRLGQGSRGPARPAPFLFFDTISVTNQHLRDAHVPSMPPMCSPGRRFRHLEIRSLRQSSTTTSIPGRRRWSTCSGRQSTQLEVKIRADLELQPSDPIRVAMVSERALTTIEAEPLSSKRFRSTVRRWLRKPHELPEVLYRRHDQRWKWPIRRSRSTREFLRFANHSNSTNAGAPPTRTSSCRATELPRNAVVGSAVNVRRCFHVWPCSSKMYSAPWLPGSRKGAPTTSCFPSIATEVPNSSSPTPSGAMISGLAPPVTVAPKQIRGARLGRGVALRRRTDQHCVVIDGHRGAKGGIMSLERVRSRKHRVLRLQGFAVLGEHVGGFRGRSTDHDMVSLHSNRSPKKANCEALDRRRSRTCATIPPDSSHSESRRWPPPPCWPPPSAAGRRPCRSRSSSPFRSASPSTPAATPQISSSLSISS